MQTTASIWEHESFYATQDFIIVGAGLAGLWCALELKNNHPSASITILERGSIPTGASTRNAGFACFGSPTELIADRDTMNETMWEVVAMRYKGINKIRKVFGDEVIEYTPCGGFECLSNEQAVIVECNLDWLNEGMRTISGLPDCFSLSDHKPEDFGFAGFSKIAANPLEGGLHSGKLVQALLQKVAQLGVKVLFGTTVSHAIDTCNSINLLLENGIEITAAKVVLCTNAFTPGLSSEVAVTAARGQVVVTAPIPGLKIKGTFHYDQGYCYFRNLGDRLLLGGGRNKAFEAENTVELQTTEVVQNELERFISAHLLPNTPFAIEHRWSGIMGFTSNKKPVIQQVSPNVTAVIACNGMGVALTPIIAEEVAARF